jgi:hypothetical protein
VLRTAIIASAIAVAVAASAQAESLPLRSVPPQNFVCEDRNGLRASLFVNTLTSTVYVQVGDQPIHRSNIRSYYVTRPRVTNDCATGISPHQPGGPQSGARRELYTSQRERARATI